MKFKKRILLINRQTKKNKLFKFNKKVKIKVIKLSKKKQNNIKIIKFNYLNIIKQIKLINK